MQTEAQSNAITATPSPGGDVVARADGLTVPEQLTHALAEIAALKAMVAGLPAQFAQAVATATQKPAVEPCREVGIAQIVPLMPPGKKSYQTIRRMIRANTIPHRREGHIFVFDPVAVKEALDTTRQKQADADWVENNSNRAIRRRNREEIARVKAMAKSRAA